MNITITMENFLNSDHESFLKSIFLINLILGKLLSVLIDFYQELAFLSNKFWSTGSKCLNLIVS